MICEAPNCTKTVIIILNRCRSCNRQLCFDHIDKKRKEHACKGKEDGFLAPDRRQKALFDQLVSEIDVAQLAAEAAAIRGEGHTCAGPTESLTSRNSPLLGGGSNTHLPFTFDDGVKWMVRIRKYGRKNTDEKATMNMASEIATLQAMVGAGIVVPQAWSSIARDSGCNLLYFFQERLEGKPYSPFLKQPIPTPDQTILGIIEQIAKWFISLEKLSFDKVGSLCSSEHNDQAQIGPVIDLQLEVAQPPYYFGPYPTAKARYLGHIDILLGQCIAGQRYAPSKQEEMYLCLKEARTWVDGCVELEEGPWYIKHAEDRGDHFLINKEGNLTGVIDWEWAYTTSKCDAFAAPNGFVDSDAFLKGSDALSPYEHALAEAYRAKFGRPDLADCVQNGKKYQRLFAFLYAETPDVIEMTAMENAFRGQPQERIEGLDSMEKWVAIVRLKYEDDAGLKAIRNGKIQ